MRILAEIIYVIILFYLIKGIDVLNNCFGSFIWCREKVRAMHWGYIRKEYNGPNIYQMKVEYEYNGRTIRTTLLDERPIEFFGKHASNVIQYVYVDPLKPEKAVLFRNRLLLRYGILYALIVVLSIADIVLISTSIF